MPGADPGEGFYNTNFQLFSTDDPAPGAVPTNQGVRHQFQGRDRSPIWPSTSRTPCRVPIPSEIMGMYAPEMLPIMSGLAKGFAVCDHWFASAPTQTIPNRAFAAAATSQGHLDNHVKVFTCPSIFGRLSDKNIDWAIYGYNRDPLTRLDFTDTQNADESHFGHFRDFQTALRHGTLPAYTFLEPSFGASGNSQHPNYDVAAGEQLIHDAYYAVRNGPGWNDTLLLITYDEHGGNYDHVPPPSGATPPDNSIGEFGFDFTRFGVRIPALLISPRIAAGTVFRAKRGTIDHTSVLKTIELRWTFPRSPSATRRRPTWRCSDAGDAAHRRSAEGVLPPTQRCRSPEQSQPSVIEKIHAHKVSLLPLRNDQGSYDRHTPPDLSSSAQIGEYIQARTAAWTQHLERKRAKHAASVATKPKRGPAAPKATRKTSARKKRR